jgi:hypothetical protein
MAKTTYSKAIDTLLELLESGDPNYGDILTLKARLNRVERDMNIVGENPQDRAEWGRIVRGLNQIAVEVAGTGLDELNQQDKKSILQRPSAPTELDSLPNYKRKFLRTRRSNLIEEYEAITGQLDSALEAGQRIRLQRQLDNLEQQIDEIDEQLAGKSQPQSSEPTREPVRGIPTSLSSPLRNTLLQCAEFRDPQSLRAVLAHEMLTPWQHSVPIVNAHQSQVSVLISYLADRYRADGQNALVLFLDVLADNYDENDQLHDELLNLTEELAAVK